MHVYVGFVANEQTINNFKLSCEQIQDSESTPYSELASDFKFLTYENLTPSLLSIFFPNRNKQYTETARRVKQIIADVLNVDPDKVENDAQDIIDLRAEERRLTKLASALQKKFKCEFSLELFEGPLPTIQDVVEYILSNRS